MFNGGHHEKAFMAQFMHPQRGIVPIKGMYQSLCAPIKKCVMRER